MSGRRVDFRWFSGTFTTWESLFSQAARFASTLPPSDLISISHSADKAEGVVTVWFWSGEPAAPVEHPVPGPDY